MPIFICIDGIDGSGKSTQIKRLAQWLEDRGRPVECTREPGGTPAGAAIRAILVNKESKLEHDTEMLLFCADRAEHQVKIRKLLAEGKDILCDRFLPSTWAYQVYGRGLESSLFEEVTQRTVSTFPDLTIILDMDVSVALRRSLSRLKAEGKEVDEGRFESEKEDFFRKVKEGFRWYASQKEFGRSVLIDASGSEDDVFAAIIEEIEEFL